MSAIIFAVASLLTASSAVAQGDCNTALADKKIPFNQIPYMVDTCNGPRGIQTGINQCNSTTQNQDSVCQTAMVNSLDDFCIWGPQKPNQSIADTEGALVAWCTKPTHGTRVIPQGALFGVQFMQTPDYLQVVGNIDQSLINIIAGDPGGEEDPHGADGRGNPLGSLVYTNGFPSNGGNNNSFQQVIEWHNFLGGNQFCFKVCDPAGAHAADFCQHIFDRIGCAYNAPADYAGINGTFQHCQGDNQDFPGVYTGADGQVSTFTQPPESLGPIATIPYTPKVPKSSNCVTLSSAELFAAGATQAPNPTSSAKPSGSSGTSKGGSGGASNTSGGSNPSQTGSHNGAVRHAAGGVAAVVAVGAAMAVFA